MKQAGKSEGGTQRPKVFVSTIICILLLFQDKLNCEPPPLPKQEKNKNQSQAASLTLRVSHS